MSNAVEITLRELIEAQQEAQKKSQDQGLTTREVMHYTGWCREKVNRFIDDQIEQGLCVPIRKRITKRDGIVITTTAYVFTRPQGQKGKKK